MIYLCFVLLSIKIWLAHLKKKTFVLCPLKLVVFMSNVKKVNMRFTISQTSTFEMGHWMAVSLFIFILSSGELKADVLTGTKKLKDQGVFSKGKKIKERLHYCQYSF